MVTGKEEAQWRRFPEAERTSDFILKGARERSPCRDELESEGLAGEEETIRRSRRESSSTSGSPEAFVAC